MNGWAKIKNAAKYADVSERTLREWLKNGLRHSRMSERTILIKYSDLDEYIERFAGDANLVENIVRDLI